MRVNHAVACVAILHCCAAVAGSSPVGEGKGRRGAARPVGKRLVIRPAPEAKWDADLDDVRKVLYSAAYELWRYFPERRLDPVLVEPKRGPIILFGRSPKGEYRVRLDTGDTYWSQYAFQFAHEFCHILCNYTEEERSNKWFEESLCELASLFVLRRMAETWKTAPPYPNWKGYAPSLRKYADKRMKEHGLPERTSLAEWYGRNEPELRRNQYLRDRNRVVAGALLPLFERDPGHWAAVEYLNAGASQESRSFREYLKDWRKHAPAKHGAFIAEIAGRFGVSLPKEERHSPPRRQGAKVGAGFATRRP